MHCVERPCLGPSLENIDRFPALVSYIGEGWGSVFFILYKTLFPSWFSRSIKGALYFASLPHSNRTLVVLKISGFILHPPLWTWSKALYSPIWPLSPFVVADVRYLISGFHLLISTKSPSLSEAMKQHLRQSCSHSIRPEIFPSWSIPWQKNLFDL